MKFFLTALLSALLMQAAQTDNSATYRDNQLHYTFHYPAGLQNRASTAARPAGDLPSKATELGARITDCTAIPVAAVRPTGARLFDMVMIMDLDLKCANERLTATSLTAFAKGMAGKILSQHGEATIGPIQNFKLAGYDAVYLTEAVDESSRSAGQVLHGASTCALIETHAVCWQMLSYNSDTLKELLALQVSFDGSQGASLVPIK